jgi:hypothetical protein
LAYLRRILSSIKKDTYKNDIENSVLENHKGISKEDLIEIIQGVWSRSKKKQSSDCW